MESTVSIGQVVAEMDLEATPEEIWAQVQQQRAQAAEEPSQKQSQTQSQKQAPSVTPAVSLASITPTRATKRRLLRGWSGLKGWLWIMFWCSGGFGLLSAFPHLSHPQTLAVSTAGVGQTLTINGDLGMTTVNAQGKDVVIDGDGDRVTLTGKARSVTVNGDFDKVIGDTPQTFVINGDFDNIQ